MSPSEGGDWPDGCIIAVDLSFPTLHPQAVLFAILDHDPREAFRANIERLRTRWMQRPAKQAKASLAFAAWEGLFFDVRGNEIHVAVPKGQPEEVAGPLSHRETYIAATGASSTLRRWIATRLTSHKGRSLVWSIPFEIAPGSHGSVLLTADNAIDLESEYSGS